MPTCVEGIKAFMTSVLNPSSWFEPLDRVTGCSWASTLR